MRGIAAPLWLGFGPQGDPADVVSPTSDPMVTIGQKRSRVTSSGECGQDVKNEVDGKVSKDRGNQATPPVEPTADGAYDGVADDRARNADWRDSTGRSQLRQVHQAEQECRQDDGWPGDQRIQPRPAANPQEQPGQYSHCAESQPDLFPDRCADGDSEPAQCAPVTECRQLGRHKRRRHDTQNQQESAHAQSQGNRQPGVVQQLSAGPALSKKQPGQQWCAKADGLAQPQSQPGER